MPLEKNKKTSCPELEASGPGDRIEKGPRAAPLRVHPFIFEPLP